MIKILFLCDTNTTLSPLAKAMLKKTISDLEPSIRIEVDTAGTHAGKTVRPASSEIKRIAKSLGLDISEHRSLQASPGELSNYRFILAMNEENFWFARNQVPKDSSTRVQLLSEFSNDYSRRDIPDPLLGEIEYQDITKILEKYLTHFAKHLSDQVKAGIL